MKKNIQKSSFGKLLIRADASSEIGGAHVIRCLSFACAWKRAGGEAYFLRQPTGQSLDAYLQEYAIPIHEASQGLDEEQDARQTINFASEIKSQWILADGKHFGTKFQNEIKKAALRLVVIDDNGEAGEYNTDFILNQNIHASKSFYKKRNPQSKLLLGPGFALLRPSFLKWRGQKQKIKRKVLHVLVTVGAADPTNVCPKILSALSGVQGEIEKITIIIGGLNPNRESLEKLVCELKLPVEFKSSVQDMAKELREADLVIAGSGSTSWELAFLGVPSISLILVDDQEGVGTELDRRGISKNLGWADRISEKDFCQKINEVIQSYAARLEMSHRGQKLVDGRGADRAVAQIMKENLQFRKATLNDADLLLKWRNEEETRIQSFTSQVIDRPHHIAWLEEKLADPNTHIFIVSSPFGIPLGQIRFGVKDSVAAISVIIDKDQRGLGYGSSMIQHGIVHVRNFNKIDIFEAEIKKTNPKSLKAFEKAGFKFAGKREVRNQPALIYTFP